TAILAQYFIDENHMDNIVVGDTDPVNTTTVKVKRLNADLIQITENSKVIQSKFDPMFESMLSISQNTFVIDNGASTFLPLIQYFNDNCVMDMFEDVEQDVYIHTVIVGGQALADTLQGFEELKELVKGSKVKLIVWINEFQGIPALENIPLIETKFIEKNKDVIAGVVVIQDRKSDAFASDIKELTEKSLTLKEAIESDLFGLMDKSRLN
ncbi:conjugal transfer protein TraL, partial [Escherichia coli]|uniref:conjugal transfer protein TraL n=1 Tax=Escherichia coli TaxID=562 RepID=UPI0030C6E8F1